MAIVLLSVAAMAIACAVLLQRLVQQQALVRVELAVTSARELLRRTGEDVLSDTKVLAERPTLQRLVTQGPADGLLPYLQRYCDSSGDDTCALQSDGKWLGTAELPWPEIETALMEQGERFILGPADGSALVFGAAVPVAGLPGRRVVIVRRGSPALLQEFGRQVGASLALVNFTTYQPGASEALEAPHAAALRRGQRSSIALGAGQGYAASIAVATTTGEIVGLLDARLADSEFATAVARFDRLVLIIAIVVALIAGLLGVLYGRWLARPVVALRDVALRIGMGDMSASMPAVAPLEVGALARSMDDMRRNLVTLTDSLRRREAEAQALLGGIVEGVFAVDAERCIRYANPQTARVLGVEPAALLGRFCGDVLRPAWVEGRRPCEHDCPIIAARTAPQSTARETLCLADGSQRSTIIVSAPPVGGVQVQIMRDETELEAVRRARDSVLGNISHEFRTPLAAQLASIELLRDGLHRLPPQAHEELLANVERGVLRLMRLIDNLLESVRIESGQLAIRLQSVELPEVVQEAAELIGPLFQQRRLGLDLQTGALQRPVPGDHQRLVQVLVNLLSNATKYAPEGSVIHISGRELPDQVELWIEDEGPGISSDSAAVIFERFQRAAGAEPDAPGLGLGLWIVKSIMSRHHGSVRVERTAQQRTRFTLSFPT